MRHPRKENNLKEKLTRRGLRVAKTLEVALIYRSGCRSRIISRLSFTNSSSEGAIAPSSPSFGAPEWLDFHSGVGLQRPPLENY